MDIKKMNKNSISDSSSIAEKSEDVNVNKSEKENDLFSVVKNRHFTWALKQTPTVLRLWAQCWEADPFGNRFQPLNTDIKGENFRKSRKVLEDAGMFEFDPIHEKTASKQRKISGWKVKNCYGSKSNSFKKVPTVSGELPTENWKVPTVSGNLEAETLTQQALQNPSLTNQYNKEINNINTGSFIPDRGERINNNKSSNLVNNSFPACARAKSPNIPKTKDEILNHAKNCLSLIYSESFPVQDWEWFEVDSVLSQLVSDGDLSKNEIELLYNRTKVEPFVDFLSYTASGY